MTTAASAVIEELYDPTIGPRVVVKDTIDVAGSSTRCGTLALADVAPSTRDAAVVQRLRSAGWRIVGKTYLHELAFGTTGVSLSRSSPVNPMWPQLVPGGSSTGSAVAIAASMAELALGTDTGGSIRVPAACCGVIGLKPTFGLVDRRGVAPVHSSLDCVGPLAADMPTVIEAMKALVPGFQRRLLPQHLRISQLRVRCHKDAAAAAGVALSVWEDARSLGISSVSSALFEPAFDAGICIINYETWAAWGSLVDGGRLGKDVEARLRRASQTTEEDVAGAEKVRVAFREEIDRLFDACDLLALPTLAGLPPAVEEASQADMAAVMTSLVRPFNLSGHPAISIPVQGQARGPYSLQLVARRGADDFLCSAAEELCAVLKRTQTLP